MKNGKLFPVSRIAPSLWKRHPGLVWSNPDAEDEAYIHAALLKPRFSVLLDIAVTLGLETVKKQWLLLQKENPSEARRVTPSVERILSNLTEGRRRAQT